MWFELVILITFNWLTLAFLSARNKYSKIGEGSQLTYKKRYLRQLLSDFDNSLTFCYFDLVQKCKAAYEATRYTKMQRNREAVVSQISLVPRPVFLMHTASVASVDPNKRIHEK